MTYPQEPATNITATLDAFSMSPHAFTAGDIIQFTATITNTSSAPHVIYPSAIGYFENGTFYGLAFNAAGTSVAAGESMDFSIQIDTSNTTIADHVRLQTLCAQMVSDGVRANNGLTLNVITQQFGLAPVEEYYPLALTYAVFDKHYAPSIPVFDVGRYDAGGQDDDGGEYVWVTATINDASAPPSGTFSASIAYAQDAEPDATSTTVDLTASIPDLLSGVTKDKTLVTATFSGNHDWYFRLTYGDAYETATALTSIGIAFAVLHLSGVSTGGVALGMFSTATEGNPKFQVNPDWAVEMGGGSGGESYDTTSGEVDTGATWTDGDGTKPIYKQIFVSTGAHTSFGSIGTISDFDKLIRMDGHVKTNANWLPIWYSAGNTYASARVSTAGAVNVIFTGSGTPTFVVIVYYTKT